MKIEKSKGKYMRKLLIVVLCVILTTVCVGCVEEDSSAPIDSPNSSTGTTNEQEDEALGNDKFAE